MNVQIGCFLLPFPSAAAIDRDEIFLMVSYILARYVRIALDPTTFTQFKLIK